MFVLLHWQKLGLLGIALMGVGLAVLPTPPALIFSSLWGAGRGIGGVALVIWGQVVLRAMIRAAQGAER